jgi:uncharacterized spore protein YtfJ
MTDTVNNFLSLTARRNEQLPEITERIFAAARPGAVFSDPITAGNYTIITASEVGSGGGFGSGFGFGSKSESAEQQQEGEASTTQPANSGGGFGVGGGSSGRPVAVIAIGPDGVTIKPIFDATKLALAGLTTVGALLAMFRRIRKAR